MMPKKGFSATGNLQSGPVGLEFEIKKEMKTQDKADDAYEKGIDYASVAHSHKEERWKRR